MKTFECSLISRGREAAVCAGVVSMALFGLLAVINQTARKVEARAEPPEPALVAPPTPDAPVVEQPRIPESPKESVVLPDLMELVLPETPQMPVRPLDPPDLTSRGTGAMVPNGIWVPVVTFEIGELDNRPNAIRKVAPEYPYEQKRLKIDGWARVVFVVDELGQVREAEIEAASDPAFGEAALKAIRNWRFDPGIKDGQAVRARMRQPFTFSAGD